MIDTNSGAARLLDYVPDGALPAATLLELTGDRAKARACWCPSGLEKRVAEAWVTPMADLNCCQCRILVGRRFGIQWLAAPVATFVACYPQAECDLYPGDLTVVALTAWADMARSAPNETAVMLAIDYQWLRREAAADRWEGSIVKQAVVALDEALEG